jgi:hypothetical protein
VADQRKPIGRPPKFSPVFVERAAIACQIGLTDEELAVLFGVTRRTILSWKFQHPEFAEALRTGKNIADDRAERTLYQRAIGYSFEAEEIYLYHGKAIRTTVTKEVLPDVTALIFWLKNRRKDQWRDVQKHEVGKPGEFDQMSLDELRASILEDLKLLNLTAEECKLLEPPPSEGVANR